MCICRVSPVLIQKEPYMNKRCVLWLNLSLTAVLLYVGTAQGVSITHSWNFHSTCYTHGKCNDTSEPVGNVRTAPSDNGLNVKVSAYAFTAPSGTGPASDAWLGQYLNTNGGLGVTNASGDSHTVDNVGNVDFVVFEFSTPVHVTSYYLNIFGDADTTWYVGNLAAGFDFTSKTLAQVNALGLTMGSNTWSSGSDPNPLETITGSVVGNYLILAASLAPTDRDDQVKIRTIAATQYTPDPVPEPGTLLLVGSGLLVLGLVARKKAKKPSYKRPGVEGREERGGDLD
jgi:hypothetical protein